MFIKMFQWHMQLYINPSHLKKKKNKHMVLKLQK